VSSEETDDVAATGRAPTPAGDRWQARIDARLERLETMIGRLPAASAERERTVAGALDSLTAQLNEFTAALVDELRESAASAIAAGVNEIRALGERDHESLTREVEAISRSVATWRVATAQDHEALVSSVAHLHARPEVDVAALAEAIEELRSRPAPDAAPLGDLTTAMAELTGELDAVGRVLQDAIASLHRIEDGTVGSNPRRDRSRRSAIAAVDDLRAAHERRTGADRGDSDHAANDPGATG
jgi:hypothetical protein